MAVTVSVSEVAAATMLDAVVAARLLAVVTEMVGHHAPDAPDVVQNEAALRLAGWLADSPTAGQRAENVGDVSTSYATPGRTSPMLASGAGALLAPYRQHRAGAIG